MQFVTSDNFNLLPYSIPAQLLEDESFQDYADGIVQELLEVVLGYTLYDQMVASLASDYPEAKWVALRDGARYTYNGTVYQWVGLTKLLVPYVYARFLRDTYDSHGGNGVSVARLENSEAISPNLRIVTAFNKAVRYIGNVAESTNSLYGFLTINATDYPDWVFTEVKPVNRFNL